MSLWDDLFRTDRSAVASLDPEDVPNTFLNGSGWSYAEDDYSDRIANNDPRFIATDCDPTGEDGAFVQDNSVREGVFWYDYGGRISREAGRLLVGAAVENDGRLFNSVTDWLQPAMQIGRNAGFQTTNTAQFASISQIGQIAGLFASRTSDIGPTTGTIGVASFVINDSDHVSAAYAYYGEAWKKADAAGYAHFLEGDIINMAPPINVGPYAMFPIGLTANLWVASGGEVAGAQSASVAIGIVNNGAKFLKGIVFHSTSVEGPALEFASGHTIQQVYPGGHFGSAITFCVNSASKQQGLLFTDFGLLLHNSVGADLLAVAVDSSYVNGLKVTPGATGVGVTLAPAGVNANTDLVLSGKGSGTIHLNNLTVTGGAGAQFGFITVRVNGMLGKVPFHNV